MPQKGGKTVRKAAVGSPREVKSLVAEKTEQILQLGQELG